MSLQYILSAPAYQYGVWQIKETVPDLEKLSGCQSPDRLTHPDRQAEYLAIRALARVMGINPNDIHYYSSGKPYLEHSSRAVSFSHTKGYASLVISDTEEAGIDMECPTDRLLKVRTKFMHPAEEEALHQSEWNELDGLLLHWCTKEAVYKAVPDQLVETYPLSFRNIILTKLPPFEREGYFSAEVLFREQLSYQLYYRVEPAYLLTIACPTNRQLRWGNRLCRISWMLPGAAAEQV
jgi:4'-phosphopantetheinyl transferase EntD